MAPTLIASYFAQSTVQGTTALTTPSFTPSNGEVVVVKMATWNTGVSMGPPTGGSQTYTSRVINAPGGGKPWAGIYTAVISGSPGSMTISASPSSSARYSMCVERWSSAALAGSPVTGSANGSGLPQASLTTSAASSIVSWVSGDVFSIDPATRAYLNSGTDEGVRDDHGGGNGVDYYAYYTAVSAGSTTFGLSAPGGQSYCIAGIEVLAAASTVNGTAGLTGAGSLSASASVRVPGTASLAGAGAVSASATVLVPGAAALAAAGTLTASASVRVPGVAAIAGAGALTAAGSSSGSAGAAFAGVGTLTASASVFGTAVKATSTASVTAQRTSTAAVTAQRTSTAAVSARATSSGGVT